jgi:two-component system, NarL family, nitrate/nitrite response regulator NarL
VKNASVVKRVLLVEDDDFTRVTVGAALQHLGVDSVHVAGSALEAMDVARAKQLDCAVLDLDLGPGPTGIDLAFGMRRLNPTLGIVILTSFSDPRLLTSSVKQPPPGSTYVVKQSLTDIRFLGEAVHGAVVMAGQQDRVSGRVDLTDAQVETLRLLAYGLSNSEIARVRVVTEKSVEQAIARAAKRLGIDAQSGVNQRVALAREYFRMTGAMRHAHAHR